MEASPRLCRRPNDARVFPPLYSPLQAYVVEVFLVWYSPPQLHVVEAFLAWYSPLKARVERENLNIQTLVLELLAPTEGQ